MRVAPEEGVEAGRVDMHGDGQDIAPRIEDPLRAVAVMQVDVEHGDPPAGPKPTLGSDGAVVQEAEAAGHVGKGMVSRRPAERIGRGRSRQHRVGGGDCRLGAPIGRSPGLGPDRTRGIGLVPARLTHGMARIGRRAPVRMDVGDDLGRSAGQRLPARVDGLEESQIVRAVHSRDGPDALVVWCGNLEPEIAQASEQRRRPCRLLGARLWPATHQEMRRVVQQLSVVEKGLHGTPAESTVANRRPRQHSHRSRMLNQKKSWSGRWESNPRHSAWEADVLPLNYARAAVF